jgi:acyl carrier protein
MGANSSMRTFEEIITEHLRIPKENISDSLAPKDVPDWDSMNYLLFVAEVEKEFDVNFTMDEVLNAASIGDVRRLLKAKGADV